MLLHYGTMFYTDRRTDWVIFIHYTPLMLHLQKAYLYFIKICSYIDQSCSLLFLAAESDPLTQTTGTTAGVSCSLSVLWVLIDMQQSFIKVSSSCGGMADVTELSSENDGVWQLQANKCRRSSELANPLVMMWWWMRSAGVCRLALHPSHVRTKHGGMKDFFHPVGWGMWFYKTRYNTYPFSSHAVIFFYFSSSFSFSGGD